MALLEIEDVSIHYGPIRALEGVNMTFDPGSIGAVIGANGAGKSSLLRAILGLVPLSGGSIRFDGSRIDDLEVADIVAHGIALSPEGRRVFPEMTVEENLWMGAFVQHGRASKSLDKVYGYFPDLGRRQRQMAGTMSGGEQQMLAIGRAIMSRPRMLLLDEPSLGLAPRIIQDVGRLIRMLNEEEGLTILIAEQNAALALTLAERAYVLQAGAIVREGPARELATDDEVRRAYLGV